MLPPHAMDSLTTAGAVGATASPWWVHYVADLSPALSLVAQVLGIIWLMTQIYHKWRGPPSPG